MTTKFRNVKDFARWYLEQPLSFARAPHDGLFEYKTEGGTVSSLILYRDGQFQAELFFGIGTGYFPEHSHPNVDSVEVVISGGADFKLNGRSVIAANELEVLSSTGALAVAGTRVRIRAGVMHGANVSVKGAAFLSLQHWLNDTAPSSVGLDWIGPEHLNVHRA